MLLIQRINRLNDVRTHVNYIVTAPLKIEFCVMQGEDALNNFFFLHVTKEIAIFFLTRF